MEHAEFDIFLSEESSDSVLFFLIGKVKSKAIDEHIKKYPIVSLNPCDDIKKLTRKHPMTVVRSPIASIAQSLLFDPGLKNKSKE